MEVRDQIANELIVLSHLTKSNSVPHLQELLGYQPLMVHNAITSALAAGKITAYNRKKGIITVDPEVQIHALQPTVAMRGLSDEIEYFMREANSREWDISMDELQLQLMMPSPTRIEIAVYLNPKLETYGIVPQKDKNTVYTFVTLKENVDKEWGRKQVK